MMTRTLLRRRHSSITTLTVTSVIFIFAVGGCLQDSDTTLRVIVSWHEGPEDIYVVNPDGSYGKRLTHSPEGRGSWIPAFSPDCSEIVFASNKDDGGPADIYIMNADGTGQRRLTRGDGYDYIPTFSPDGSKIFFLRTLEDGQNVWLMNRDGTNPRRLFPAAQESLALGNPWSPYGSTLLFIATPRSAPRIGIQPVVTLSGADLYTSAGDGSGIRRLTNVGDTTEGNGLGVWSHDGTQIAFASDRDGNWEVWLMNADGTDQRQLTYTEGTATVNIPVAWSPDDRIIAFGSSRDGKGENPWIYSDVYTLDVESGVAQRRTHTLEKGGHARATEWAPDGIHGIWRSDGSVERAGTFRLVGDAFAMEPLDEPAGHGASCPPDRSGGDR